MSGRRSAPSLPNRADEQEHEHEQNDEKGFMSYFLFFLATVLAGTINALAGGGGLITFPLLMLVVTPVTADAASAVALFQFLYATDNSNALGNQSPRQNRNLYSERINTYERVNCNHSGIHSGVRDRCVARSQRG